MKLDVGICTYANPRGLNAALSSISALADRIIVVHNRYQGFSLEDPDSLTLTKAVLERYPNTVLIDQSEPLWQIEARNKYLETTDADFLIPMDDDEIMFRYNHPKFYSKLQKIMEQDEPELFELWYLNYDGKPFYNHRLLYKPNRFRYVGNHWNLMVDGKFYGQSGKRNVDGLTLKHINWQESGRTREWEKAFERYEIQQHFTECQTPQQILDKHFKVKKGV
jgi:hypothetical protein